MDILSAVILGIIQGATEFIPVSSSAALSGLLSIKLIKTVSGRSGPGHFSIYCFAIGAAAIVGAHG